MIETCKGIMIGIDTFIWTFVCELQSVMNYTCTLAHTLEGFMISPILLKEL